MSQIRRILRTHAIHRTHGIHGTHWKSQKGVGDGECVGVGVGDGECVGVGVGEGEEAAMTSFDLA